MKSKKTRQDLLDEKLQEIQDKAWGRNKPTFYTPIYEKSKKKK